MEKIVAAHGPMPETSLARHIAQLHGWQRTGARVQARIVALAGLFDTTIEEDARFLWLKGSVKDRLPFKGMAGRSLREISRSEIAELIDRNASRVSGSEDPELEIARLAGIARLSKDAREYLEICRRWGELSRAAQR